MRHTCIRKQQGWIIVWNSRRRRNHSVSSVFKVLEESVPDLKERLVLVRQMGTYFPRRPLFRAHGRVGPEVIRKNEERLRRKALNVLRIEFKV